MADFITSISTIADLRTWWDSTVPSTVPSGDNYIAELAAGTYIVGSVSSVWGSKTVNGNITIRAPSGARLTNPTRPLRGGTDGVVFRLTASIEYQFTANNVILEGMDITGDGLASLYLEGGKIRNCVIDNVQYKTGIFNPVAQDSAFLHSHGTCSVYVGNVATFENCSVINFGTGPAVLVGANFTIKNSAFVALSAANAFQVSSGSAQAGSTNNAFNVGATYGAAPISITASAQFENVASLATADLRLKSGASLATAGASGVGTGADVYWQTRTASYSVGAYELDAGGGTPSLVVSDGVHAHSADNLVLTIIGTLSIADAAHAHAADSITLTAMSNGTITIPAVRDWGTKALKTGQTGVQVDIRNITTGALVVRKTGQTTHASTGVCVVTDAAIVVGTTYEVVTRFADGSRGMWDYTAS